MGRVRTKTVKKVRSPSRGGDSRGGDACGGDATAWLSRNAGIKTVI